MRQYNLTTQAIDQAIERIDQADLYHADTIIGVLKHDRRITRGQYELIPIYLPDILADEADEILVSAREEFPNDPQTKLRRTVRRHVSDVRSAGIPMGSTSPDYR